MGSHRRLPRLQLEGDQAAELRRHSTKTPQLAHEGLAQALLHSGRRHLVLRQIQVRCKKNSYLQQQHKKTHNTSIK